MVSVIWKRIKYIKWLFKNRFSCKVVNSKLDRVGPVDNRPSTNKLHHFVKKKSDMQHVTHDMWHMTHDMQRVTCDMVRGVNILSKFQPRSSSGLWLMIFWRLGGKGWLTQWINDEADCRAGPARPGLLITVGRVCYHPVCLVLKVVRPLKAIDSD